MSRPDTSYRQIIRLSTPVMLSQLSYTAMGIIDTIMVGRVGVVALAIVTNSYAVSLSMRKLIGEHGSLARAFRNMDRPLVKGALLRDVIAHGVQVPGLGVGGELRLNSTLQFVSASASSGALRAAGA